MIYGCWMLIRPRVTLLTVRYPRAVEPYVGGMQRASSWRPHVWVGAGGGGGRGQVCSGRGGRQAGGQLSDHQAEARSVHAAAPAHGARGSPGGLGTGGQGTCSGIWQGKTKRTGKVNRDSLNHKSSFIGFGDTPALAEVEDLVRVRHAVEAAIAARWGHGGEVEVAPGSERGGAGCRALGWAQRDDRRSIQSGIFFLINAKNGAGSGIQFGFNSDAGCRAAGGWRTHKRVSGRVARNGGVSVGQTARPSACCIRVGRRHRVNAPPNQRPAEGEQ